MLHGIFTGASRERGKYFCCESCHVSVPRQVLLFTPLTRNASYPSRDTSRNLHGASRMQGKVQCQFTFTVTFTAASRTFTDACFLKLRGKTGGKARRKNFMASTCVALQGVLRRRSYIERYTYIYREREITS